MNEELLEIIQKKLYDFSGIKIAEVQKNSLWQFVLKLSAAAGLSPEQYCNALTCDDKDFAELINHITVNETYFFREEKQFDVLKNHIFPEFAGRKMNIWSAACSSGEEAISLLTLALSCNIDAQIFASDIDDSAIMKLKNGIYPKYSFRGDGKKFHDLLIPYCRQDGDNFKFDKSIQERIHISRYNLKNEHDFPFMEKMDLIFIRNVFIYFAKDTRIKISNNICSRLNDGGYLFFSMNEIGCMDDSVIPQSLYKVNQNAVYYFVKGNNPNQKKNDLFQASRKLIQEKQLEKVINGKSDFLLSIREKIEEKKANVLKQKKLDEYKFRSDKESNVSVCNSSSFNDGKKIENNSKFLFRQEYFDRICKEINVRNYDNAYKILEEVKKGTTSGSPSLGSPSIGSNSFELSSDLRNFSFFLEGYIEYHSDNKEKAEQLFSTAEILQSEFWPVWFYHGMVLKDMGKSEKAEFCLKKCMELLDDNDSGRKSDFTLDSFSPKYIYSLCESMLKV